MSCEVDRTIRYKVMKAVRWHAQGDLRLEDVAPPPPPGPGEIKIEVLSCGICGTDAEEYKAGPIFIPCGTSHPLTEMKAPIILGHEVCGRVIAVGDRSNDALIGSMVAVDGLVFCGRCRSCHSHRFNLCESLGSIGFSANGGLAELANVPARGTFAIADGISADAGALAETLAVGVRALRRGRFAKDERVAIVGAGSVGLLAALAALYLGAMSVTLVEPNQSRRELAQAIGPIDVLTPSDVSDIGADLVLECSGAREALSTAMACAATSGRIVLLGITSFNSELANFDVVRRELQIIGSLSHVYDEDFATAVELINSGSIDSGAIVTSVVSLRYAIDKIVSLSRGEDDGLKTVVHPQI